MHTKKSKKRVFTVLDGNIFPALTFYFGRKKGGTSCEGSNESKVLHISLNNVCPFQGFTIRGYQFLSHLQQAVVMESHNPWE